MQRILRLAVVVLGLVLGQNCEHGNYSPDTERCECHPCWSGPNCSERPANCVLNVETNQAFVKEEYWRNLRQNDPQITIPSVYRTAYQPTEVWHPGVGAPGIGAALADVIRNIHRRWGNAIVEDRSIVLAHGGTQLMQAAFYAYARQRGGRAQTVHAPTPYYYLLPFFAGMNPGISQWVGNPTNTPDIEIVTCPNNPNGVCNTPRFPQATILYDAVFAWPSYTQVYEARDHPVQIFSLSKLTGHSGSRLGWAFVEDREIASYMGEYIYYTTHGVAIDGQLRALVYLKEMLEDNGAIFVYTRDVFINRWDRMIDLFERQRTPRFEISGQRDFCLLWIRCLETPENCGDQFANVGIRVREGIQSGQRDHVRLNMMIHNSNYDLLLERMERLLLGDVYTNTTTPVSKHTIDVDVSTVEDAFLRDTQVPMFFE